MENIRTENVYLFDHFHDHYVCQGFIASRPFSRDFVFEEEYSQGQGALVNSENETNSIQNFNKINSESL